jgi:hypothetical protein
MAQGRRTLSPYLQEQILADYAMTSSPRYTAEKFKVDENTVRKLVRDRQDDFNELREEMKTQMTKEIWGNLVKAQQLGNKMLEEALTGQREIPLNHVSTYFGTMYDKQALMNNENTQKMGMDGIQVVFGMPDVAEDEEGWKEVDEGKDKS